MKKPSIIFALKCTAILYLSAFTDIDIFTKDKAATPLITKGNCSVNLQGVDEFSSYTFIFQSNGNVIAKKEGIEVKGQWTEDYIAKKINIYFSTYNPTLSKLNNRWIIKDVNENQLFIESPQGNNPSLVTIASL